MIKWIDAKTTRPPVSGYYQVKFNGYSDDISRYNRGIFGLRWLSYWSDEKYGLRDVTHWRKF